MEWVLYFIRLILVTICVVIMLAALREVKKLRKSKKIELDYVELPKDVWGFYAKTNISAREFERVDFEAIRMIYDINIVINTINIMRKTTLMYEQAKKLAEELYHKLPFQRLSDKLEIHNDMYFIKDEFFCLKIANSELAARDILLDLLFEKITGATCKNDKTTNKELCILYLSYAINDLRQNWSDQSAISIAPLYISKKKLDFSNKPNLSNLETKKYYEYKKLNTVKTLSISDGQGFYYRCGIDMNTSKENELYINTVFVILNIVNIMRKTSCDIQTAKRQAIDFIKNIEWQDQNTTDVFKKYIDEIIIDYEYWEDLATSEFFQRDYLLGKLFKKLYSPSWNNNKPLDENWYRYFVYLDYSLKDLKRNWHDQLILTIAPPYRTDTKDPLAFDKYQKLFISWKYEIRSRHIPCFNLSTKKMTNCRVRNDIYTELKLIEDD